ncbi:MAG: alpha-L-fucosidase [Ignavibacteriaceae bacterium]
MFNLKFHPFLLLFFIFLINTFAFSQNSSNYILINPDDTPEQIITKAANVTPSSRQYEWQKLELTAFVHFGINTFDEVEWGKKDIDISNFNPKDIDVKQWVKVFKDAGMKMVILTAKHHDGFCLWPTRYKDLNISNTPFQDGKGDIVRDLSEACREAGLKFGIYLSPWDMNEKSYGTPEYNELFRNQLTELLTNYGEIAEVWFDGANGEGPNGKRQIYNWQSYYEVIRRLQPNAVIAISGPDVRWVGTESGYGRQTEWSVLPAASMDQDEIAANSQQQALDGGFIPRDLMDEDLGSREKVLNASALVWYPSEVDVSIRPGWFYHPKDDAMVKSPYKLVDIYYNSVGLNSLLLLNVPPDKRGLISEHDIESLQGMRYILDETFKTNLSTDAIAAASNESKEHKASLILDNDTETYWTTEEGISSASIEIQLKNDVTFNRIMLQENILAGQRIEKFHIEWWDGNNWSRFTEGTTIGYKRLLRFPVITANKIKIVIDECRTKPTLSSFGLYIAPPKVEFDKYGGSFEDSIYFNLSSDLKNTKVYYTTDGSIPDKNSKEFTGRVLLTETATVTAVAVADNGQKSLPVKAYFNKAKYRIELKSAYDKKYPARGTYTLVDGVNGSIYFDDGKWQGYNGVDIEVVIDLENTKKIDKISARFLSNTGAWIFLPKSVEYFVSEDGKNFQKLTEVKNDTDEKDKGAFIHSFNFNPVNTKARFINIKANNIKVCPEWHQGAGDKAWLFIDEITVE